MKKILAGFLLAAMAAGSVFAENGLAISGDVKTGLRVEKKGDDGATTGLGNDDDAGTQGRFRVNFVWTKDNLQIKWRLQATEWTTGGVKAGDVSPVAYAYAVGDFFDNQFRMMLGKFDGDEQWNTSGPIWESPESQTGAKFHFTPKAVPGLNVGFLIPAVTSAGAKTTKKKTTTVEHATVTGLTDGSGGTVVGTDVTVEWEEDEESTGSANKFVPLDEYFLNLGYGIKYDIDPVMFRVFFLGDSENNGARNGAVLDYRLELKFIKQFVPGLDVWFSGFFNNLPIHDGTKDRILTRNVFSFNYVAGSISELSLDTNFYTYQEKHDDAKDRAMRLLFNPCFVYKVLPDAFGEGSSIELGLEGNVDLTLGYQDGKDKTGDKDRSMFNYLDVMPAVKFNFGNGAWIRPHYRLRYGAENGQYANYGDAITEHRFELRFGYGF